jgi:hypothetical protein
MRNSRTVRTLTKRQIAKLTIEDQIDYIITQLNQQNYKLQEKKTRSIKMNKRQFVTLEEKIEQLEDWLLDLEAYDLNIRDSQSDIEEKQEMIDVILHDIDTFLVEKQKILKDVEKFIIKHKLLDQ